MATLKLYFDRRSCRADGKYPVKMMLRHHGSVTSIPLDLYFDNDEWYEVETRLKAGTESRHPLSRLVSQSKAIVESALIEVRLSHNIDKMDIAQLKKEMYSVMERKLSSRDEQAARQGAFLPFYRKCTERKAKASTRSLYQQTEKKIVAFCPEAEGFGFEDITVQWLKDFDRFLKDTSGPAVRNRHFRNIRSVFNDALDEELTAFYPFRRFKMPKLQETRKRYLTIDNLKLLRDYECEPWAVEYRDMFMLMFYLIGINAVDLFNAREVDIVNGRLEYRREKTMKPYSIKIEPEAAEIIERYRGETRLLSPLDRYSDYRDYLAHMNRALKKIGKTHRQGCGYEGEALFSFLTSYYARHSWATIASQLDVPIETISRALGHSIGSEVTNIYIAFDQSKIDRANRLVLDALK